jgi:peptidoglycan-associated lipoprotein
MRSTAIAVVAASVLALVACGGKKPSAPPSPPPAAPATPPPAPQPVATAAPQVDEYTRLQGMSAEEIDRLGLFQDPHFDYDKADIRDADREVLTRDAEILRKFDFLKVTVEGHCDERGTVDYNLALGTRRSKAAYDYLVTLGVPADRLKTVSYGKEFPLCQEANEACWARNRRAHLVVTGKTTR